jgi:hypothetical protein
MIDGEFTGEVTTDGPGENLMNDTHTLCAKCSFEGQFHLFDPDQPIQLHPYYDRHGKPCTKEESEASWKEVQVLWDNNEIQFARLLCELRANCDLEGMHWDLILESMDLEECHLDELWRRADQVWEKSKADHCPPPKAKPDFGGVGRCRIPLCPHCKVGLVRDANDKPGFHHCPKCNSSFMSIKVICDNCRWKGLEVELEHKLPDIPDLAARLDVAGVVPAGTCPKCGALAYVLGDSPDCVIPHLDHVDRLELNVLRNTDGQILAVEVDCTRCGGDPVCEIYNSSFDRSFEAKCPVCGELGYDNPDDCSFCQDQKEGGIRGADNKEA